MSSAITFACKICKNNVTNSDQDIQCDLCDPWVHIKYNDLSFIDYKFLQNSNDPWFCISCCSEIFPFSTVKNKNFISNFYDSNKASNIVCKDSSLLLKPSEHLKQLVNHFNMSSQTDDINSVDPENTVSSKYYNIYELQNLKINNSNSLSLFHINACSLGLSRNFDDLQHLSCTNKISDIIAITETRIKENVSTTNNLSIKNYSIKFTPTESSAGGTLLYIANHLLNKPRQD